MTTPDPAPLPDPIRPPPMWTAFRRLRPDPRRSLANLAIAVPCGLVWLAASCHGIVQQHDRETWAIPAVVVEYRPWVPVVLALAATTACGAIARWSHLSSVARRPHVAVAWGVLLVAPALWALQKEMPRAGGKEFLRNAGLRSPTAAPDGTVCWVYCWESSVDGKRWSGPFHRIAVENGSTFAHRRFDVIGRSGPVALIRPASDPDLQGLLLDEQGRALLIEDEGWCSGAYDPRTNARLNDCVISPFHLLGDDLAGSSADLERMHRGCLLSSEACLLQALESRNAWVREAARTLIRAGPASLYPEATKRL